MKTKGSAWAELRWALRMWAAQQSAEMPDFYAEGEFDLSGFAVGIVKKDSVIDGKNIVAGDVLIDNIPRVFPKGLGASIYKESWEVPTLFKWIQEAGRIEYAEMSRTFNMGIGMVLVVTEEASRKILEEGQHKAYALARLYMVKE
ncbi:hypothetical protein OIU77_010691 [Salix suchowensis]|uniref:phosphoribosylformylglycinamidine cyclo-ligase n=1 Tax=Salix suchowensis TaxID=1278906 RepID=A0ABQ9A9F3_9ROSI|nr:hypothetical protein OIU77_010691 [Salix suchowensis]